MIIAAVLKSSVAAASVSYTLQWSENMTGMTAVGSAHRRTASLPSGLPILNATTSNAKGCRKSKYKDQFIQALDLVALKPLSTARPYTHGHDKQPAENLDLPRFLVFNQLRTILSSRTHIRPFPPFCPDVLLLPVSSAGGPGGTCHPTAPEGS